jgi:hypothetical protein
LQRLDRVTFSLSTNGLVAPFCLTDNVEDSLTGTSAGTEIAI